MNVGNRPRLVEGQHSTVDRAVFLKTYTFQVIDLAHPPHPLSSSNNRYSLDGDAIAEAGAFAVDDARNVDVGLHAVLFASFDDIVVCADSLERP